MTFLKALLRTRLLPVLLAPILCVSGLLYSPPAKATLYCLATTQQVTANIPRFSSSKGWEKKGDFYDVPVGGTMYRQEVTLQTMIQKVGTVHEGLRMRAFLGSVGSGTWYPAYSASGFIWNDSIGVRITIDNPYSHDVVITNSYGSPHLIHVGTIVAPTTGPAHSLPSVKLVLEIIRTKETPSPTDRWSNGTFDILTRPAIFTFEGEISTLQNAALCDTGIASFSDLGPSGGGSPPIITPTPQPSCTVNDGNPINVDFGRVRAGALRTVGQLPDNFTKRETVINYSCKNTPTTNPPYTLTLQGDASPHAPALRSNRAGVGVIVENAQGTVVPVNTGEIALPNAGIASGSSTRIYSYPTRVDASDIQAGLFKATATLKVNIR